MPDSRDFIAVLGGNALACQPIERLRAAGYRLLVIDGNPAAPARALADKFIHVNFSRTDETLRAVAEYDLCAVMPLNDFGVRTAAELARQRGLPGNSPEAAWRATNKQAMKAAWNRAGLPTAPHISIPKAAVLRNEPIEWSSFPCIVKPAFSGGGSRGVAIVEDVAGIRSFVAENLPYFIDDEVIIEQFVAGSEHTVEVLLWNANAKVLSISDKQNYPQSVTVVQNLYFPGPVGTAHKDAIERLVLEACKALELTCGAAHFEVLLVQGQPILLEVGARPGGGINLFPICELSTGYDYPLLYAQALTGREPEFKRTTPTWHLAWHYFPAGAGVVSAVSGVELVRAEPDVVDCQVYETVGNPRLDLRNDLARPGYVLVKGASHGAAKSRAGQLVERVRIETSLAAVP